MENTLINKDIYFAQYWGQDNLVEPDGTFKVWFTSDKGLENAYLLLKPLSAISDEDAIEVAKFAISEYYKEENEKQEFPKEFTISRNKFDVEISYGVFVVNIHLSTAIVNVANEGACLHCYQYLQSKSYALPFHGLSVEELQSRGWLRLIEK